MNRHQSAVRSSSIHHFLLSFSQAFHGWRVALRERNMRVHLAVVVGVTMVGLMLNLATWEWLFVLLAIGLVMALELVNCAVEDLADVVRDTHGLDYLATKHTRDIAAGAVLAAAITAAAIGVIIFLPKLLALIQ